MNLRRRIPFWLQVIFLFAILAAPSLIRYAFLRNDWRTYTDQRYGYALEYPAHLGKSLSYAGFQGNREIHLLLSWPDSIEITHQISVGEVGITSPTVEEVADFAKGLILERGGQIVKGLETIDIDNKTALTRTYIISGRKYKEVYIAGQERGFLLRFTAVSQFYDNSVKDFDRVVTTFRTANEEP